MRFREATAAVYKSVKVRRRREKRESVLANDSAVTAATATAAPNRIDDETRGLPIGEARGAQVVGTLINPRACYICKQRYVEVDAFYHQLCPACAAFSHGKREARTDLTGRRALLTGGRAKIGMHIALRLLRDGADTTITTRFPNDAVRRFTAMPDSADWLHRLRIVGIDLRDPAQVRRLADSVAARGPLDILINNAAQTVRRSPGAYGQLVAAESAELPAGPLPEVVDLGHAADAHPPALGRPGAAGVHGRTRSRRWRSPAGRRRSTASPTRPPSTQAVSCPTSTTSTAGPARWRRSTRSSCSRCSCATSPRRSSSSSRLRPAMAAAPARRKYVVNVSAMEGQFGRGYKGPGHPHTNMAKAALNMLTRTSAKEMLETDGILMTAVDTGWITDERPAPAEGAPAPGGLRRPARPRRRRRPRLRPDRPR